MGLISDPSYWAKVRNQSQPLIVTTPGVQQLNNVQSEGAWRITIGVLGDVGTKLTIYFNNKQELTMVPGDPFLVLEGQPYLKRDDTFSFNISGGTLIFIRDIVKDNVESKEE